MDNNTASALGQKKYTDIVLDGHNVTDSHLKNIVTDKPAPITGPTPSLA